MKKYSDTTAINIYTEDKSYYRRNASSPFLFSPLSNWLISVIMCNIVLEHFLLATRSLILGLSPNANIGLYGLVKFKVALIRNIFAFLRRGRKVLIKVTFVSIFFYALPLYLIIFIFNPRGRLCTIEYIV